MPRYFFDTGDDSFQHRDETGRELPDIESVQTAAAMALPDLARQGVPATGRRSFSVWVRDDKGARVYSTSLTLRSRWADQGGALDGVVDVLVDALDVAQQEGDETTADLIRNALVHLGKGLAEQVGRKAAGVKLN